MKDENLLPGLKKYTWRYVVPSICIIPVENIKTKIVFMEYYNEGIGIIGAGNPNHHCYQILVGEMVDYKKHVLITKMKLAI